MPVDLAAVMQLFKMSSGSSLSNKEPAKKVDMLKAMLSSSSKPPPSHPILKKPRGPSTSGPRPTARFVSPAGSHDETDNRESEASSSTSTAGANTSRLKSSGSSTSKQKTKKLVSVGHRKKAAGFVASSASKRRPVAPRRQSSQSSATGSEVGSREERSSLSSRYPVPQRPVSTIPEQPGGAVTTVPRDDGGQLSAKAAGKRPAFITTGSSDSGRSQLAAVPQQSIVKQLDVPSSRPLEPKVQISGKDVVYKSSRNRPRQTEEERRTPVHDQSSAQEHTRPEHEPVTLSRGIVDENASKTVPRDVQHNRRVPPQGLLSTSTATTSNIAAQGTITEFAENASAWAAATARQEEALETGLRRSGSAATLNPAPPSSSPSLPLGRSKSQLTLLLKRQEEKRTRR